jgi:hypothetical protein
MTKMLAAAAAAGLIIVSAVPGSAAPKNTPGHMMQQKGSVPGHPGASGYAPGHLKKMRGAHDASAYAPGHRKKARR